MERVRKLQNENKNLQALEEERDRLDKLKDAFNEAHGAYVYLSKKIERPLIFGTTSVTEIISK